MSGRPAAQTRMLVRLTIALAFFNFIGLVSARVVLSLYALDLGASASAVGVLAGMFYMFPLLLSFPVGSWADRSGPRGPLLVGSLCGTAALLIPWFVREVPAFYFAAALSGLGLAFTHVTLQNLMGTISRPEDRARNFSNFSLVGSMTNFIGPLIAGFSIDHFGHPVACVTVSALVFVGVLLLVVWGRRLPGPRRTAAAGSGGNPLRALADPATVRMLVASGLVQLGMDLFQFYLQIHGHQQGLSATAIGAILASFAAATLVVRLALARLVARYPVEQLLAVSFYIGAVGFALVPFFGNAVVLSAIAFVFGLGMGVGTPLSVMMMFNQSAEGRSGQALGLRLTTTNLLRMGGPAVFGAVAAAFGLPPVFWINAAMMGVGGVLARSGRKRG